MVAVLCEARWSRLSGLPLSRSYAIRAPSLPRGAVRGCSYLKWRVEGRFFLSPGWSPTPPKSMLNRLSSSRGSPWCFFFFERIRFQDFFYFFVEKTLLLMKNQHFIIIITFHQITLCVLATMPPLIHLYTSIHLNFKPPLYSSVSVGHF